LSEWGVGLNRALELFGFDLDGELAVLLADLNMPAKSAIGQKESIEIQKADVRVNVANNRLKLSVSEIYVRLIWLVRRFLA